MSHTPDCKTRAPEAHADTQCDCFEPNTDWAPDEPCGGISVNRAEPPWCETHMKPFARRLVETNLSPTRGHHLEGELAWH